MYVDSSSEWQHHTAATQSIRMQHNVIDCHEVAEEVVVEVEEEDI